MANEKNVSMSNLCNTLLWDAILKTYQEEREYLPEYIKSINRERPLFRKKSIEQIREL